MEENINVDYIKVELDKVIKTLKPDSVFGYSSLYAIATHFYELGARDNYQKAFAHIEELELSKSHYDIVNFKPKQWVLVRDDDEWEWALTRFSHLSDGSASLFICINGASFQQCIPFEGNERLLGTTDMPDECYINW